MPKLMLKKETLAKLQNGLGLDQVQGGTNVTVATDGVSAGFPYFCFSRVGGTGNGGGGSAACPAATTVCDITENICRAV